MKDNKKVIIPDEFVGRLYNQYDSLTRNFRFVFGGTVVFGLLFYYLVFDPATKVFIDRENIGQSLVRVQDSIFTVEAALESTQELDNLLNRMDDDLAKASYDLRNFLIKEGYSSSTEGGIEQSPGGDWVDIPTFDFSDAALSSFDNKADQNTLSPSERMEAESRRRNLGRAEAEASQPDKIERPQASPTEIVNNYVNKQWKETLKKPDENPANPTEAAPEEANCESLKDFDKIYLCKAENYLGGYFDAYIDGLEKALGRLRADSRIPKEEIRVLREEFKRIGDYAIELLRSEQEKILRSFNGKERLFEGIREKVKAIIPEKAPVFYQLRANSRQEIKSLKALRKIFEEQTERLSQKEEEIKHRMASISIPVINITAEIFGSTEIFPLLLTIGFIISIYLYTEKLRIRESFISKYLAEKYNDLDQEDFSLTLPIWLDPSIPLRQQGFKIGYLLLPLFVFIGVMVSSIDCYITVGEFHTGLISSAVSALILIFCTASFILGYAWLLRYYKL